VSKRSAKSRTTTSEVPGINRAWRHAPTGDVVAHGPSATAIPPLSQREKDCLIWTARGKSSCDIGTILAISPNTVNFHIKNAMKKLGTGSRTVAVIKAIQHDIIDITFDAGR
jgi:DNA-binding CsgD family transcriptional regulator